MSEFHAAVALAALDEWPSTRLRLGDLTERCSRTSIEAGLKPHPAMADGDVTPYWIVELASAVDKQELMQRLDQQNIAYRNWWSEGCHAMPAYESLEREALERTDYLASVTIGLPFFLDLTEAQLLRIRRALNNS
jgi:dTDP-4-amino-4,6-dideoxygalactose transaminase